MAAQAEAQRWEETDWPQILVRYRMLSAFPPVHAHLLTMNSEHKDAARFFTTADALATSAPEQRYLLRMIGQQGRN